ncbi:MAG: DUF452 family protein [Prevotellaceae bacterium]|jgi:biotin synthesis protein BioG|nr:DUF452 family protein [Prevotellaceae bacterium]
MTVFWHKKQNSRQLLLLFNGWGFDQKIFQDVELNGCDTVSVYDYAAINPDDFNFTRLYPEVLLAAWSYGVFVADLYSENIFNLKKAIAVNGSTTPINNLTGIPVNIFLATMQSFNAKNREKFYIRTAGGLTAYKQLSGKLPERTVENQLNELQELYKLSLKTHKNNGINWQIAIVSEQDKIFPIENMKHAWGDKATVTAGEHYRDFDRIINFYLTD